MLYFLTTLLGLLVGLPLGAAACAFYLRRRQVLSQTDQAENRSQLKESFAALAAEALHANSQQLLQGNNQQLESKQQLIGTTLENLKTQMGLQLTTVTERLAQLEKERHTQYQFLGIQLTTTQAQLGQLSTTTTELKNALSNARVRGQWGERMADDVLRLAGLQEHISFRRQSTLTGDEGGKSRPDLTFLLPGGKVIHMDVKFPLDGYLAYLEAPDDATRLRAKKSFLSAARQRIKETASREYRTASTQKNEQPLDYVLVFIPNEQVYAFLLEHDPDLLGEAIRSHVILCSPTTLLAVLAVIRQAMENFGLEQRTAEVQTLILKFRDQWQKFMDEHDKIGDLIQRLQTQFTTVVTTRRSMLERPLGRLTEHAPASTEIEKSLEKSPLLAALPAPAPERPN